MLIAPAIALADGFMVRRIEVGTSTPMVASPRQEALLICDGPTVRVILRTHSRAGPKEVAWIIPVPAAPSDVKPADDAIFRDLESQTAPRFVSFSGGGVGLGCGATAGRETAAPGVIVEAAGTAGIFDWTALGATDAAKLAAWLSENKYAVPVGVERVLAPYVKGGWHYLAVKVRAEEAAKPTVAPHPIAYTYRADRLVYPLAISQLSADLENEIVLYVLAKERMVTANWACSTATALGPFKPDRSPSGSNYEAVLRRTTDDSAGHLFVTEFAGDINGSVVLDRITGRPSRIEQLAATYLTRLRAIMTPKAMDRDVALKALGASDPVRNVHRVAGAGRPAGLPLGLLAAASVGVVASRFLIAGPRRVVGACVLVAAALAIAAL